MHFESENSTADTAIDNGDPELQEKLRSTIRKLKLERERHAKSCEQIEALSRKLADVERKYRSLFEAGTALTGSTGQDVIERIHEIVVCPLDGNIVRQRIAGYHAAIGKKGYDHVWRERMLLIQQVVESGETNLMRVLSIVRGIEENRRGMGLNSRRWVLNDKFIDLPWRPAAASYRSAVFEAVLSAVRAQTTKIIETGSGWGEHLCNVFLNGGPYDATYYACELEEEGRKCSLMLAALEPMFRLETCFFDYLAPDYSTIPVDDGHTILLTAHSVEQVSQIHEDCIRAALELGQDVTGIHFEPIGWQTQLDGSLSEVSQSHRTRCLELHYNENLWPLLQKLQNEGLIKILNCDVNMIGLDYNPATFITWEKVT